VQINPKVRRRLQIQKSIFLFLVGLIIISLAWLSKIYEFQSDWTHSLKNTPSRMVLGVLGNAHGPITVTAFISESNSELRKSVTQDIEFFRRYKNDFVLKFVDPITDPGLAREQNINAEGELVIEYEQRSEKLRQLDEQTVANAIQRLLRNEKSWITFLEGHGERSPFSDGNLEYSVLRQQLETKGFNVRTINLASQANIPDDTSTLVIADPQNNLLDGEIQLIQEYVDAGKNLLWLNEPHTAVNLESLAEQLGIEILPGMIVDFSSQLLGISDPRFVMIPEYPTHPITNNFQTVTLFPTAVGMEYLEAGDWDTSTLLETLPRSWIETEELNPNDEITMDAGIDTPGPISLGLAVTRFIGQGNLGEAERDPLETGQSELDMEEQEISAEHQQRIIVIGDADFIADAYIGEAGNLDLILNTFSWLTKDDAMINIPARSLVDKQLNLSLSKQLFITISFLVIVPLTLIAFGVTIWIRRRRT